MSMPGVEFFYQCSVCFMNLWFLVCIFKCVTFGHVSFFLSGFLFKILCCLFSSPVWRNKLRTWRFKKRRNVEFYHLWQSLRSASPFYITAAHAGIYSRWSLIGWNHTLLMTSLCKPKMFSLNKDLSERMCEMLWIICLRFQVFKIF